MEASLMVEGSKAIKSIRFAEEHGLAVGCYREWENKRLR